jgi:hypothetical protein
MIDQELLTYLAEMESRIIGAIAREPEPKPPESFDLVEAAKFLGRSSRWLRDNCTGLGIGHEPVGRGFRFTLHELERYLARHRRKGKKGLYEA